jgi:hypothetical protein
LNPHALAGTSPSSWRVCLFRHSDVLGDYSIELVDGSASSHPPKLSREAQPALGAVSGLVGGTRIPQVSGNQSSPGPLGFRVTPAV